MSLRSASHRLASVAKWQLNATLAPALVAGASTRRSLNIASRPSDLVGNTPLIDLNKILVNHGVDVSNGTRLVGKLESLGPCSSVKDRIGRSMVRVFVAQDASCYVLKNSRCITYRCIVDTCVSFIYAVLYDARHVLNALYILIDALIL